MQMPTVSHNVTMSMPKRGEVTMPAPTHTTSDHCSCWNNWLHSCNQLLCHTSPLCCIHYGYGKVVCWHYCWSTHQCSVKTEYSDIVTPSDPSTLDPNTQWTHIDDGALIYLGCLHVPNINDLCLWVYRHYMTTSLQATLVNPRPSGLHQILHHLFQS